MIAKTRTPAATWIRYTHAEYTDVLFRHKTGRALPGDWDWTPKQLAEIRAQYPNISDEDFKASYWVCEGGCMFCGAPLTAKQKCSGPVRCMLSFRIRTARSRGAPSRVP
jgi:hypothetical protein